MENLVITTDHILFHLTYQNCTPHGRLFKERISYLLKNKKSFKFKTFFFYKSHIKKEREKRIEGEIMIEIDNWKRRIIEFYQINPDFYKTSIIPSFKLITDNIKEVSTFINNFKIQNPYNSLPDSYIFQIKMLQLIENKLVNYIPTKLVQNKECTYEDCKKKYVSNPEEFRKNVLGDINANQVASLLVNLEIDKYLYKIGLSSIQIGKLGELLSNYTLNAEYIDRGIRRDSLSKLTKDSPQEKFLKSFNNEKQKEFWNSIKKEKNKLYDT